MMRRTMLLVLGVVACQPQLEIPRTVVLYMECVECATGELDSIVSGGNAYVPILTRLLAAGPPQALVTQLERTVRLGLTDSALAPAPPLPDPRREAIVAQQVGDFKVMYRVRSAIALGSIGTQPARAALCDSHPAPISPLLQAAIDSALMHSGGPC
jgi:hypothetical protein